MLLEIRHVNLQVSDALQEFVQLYVERALRPFEDNVERVEVRIQDINGPRGGVDKRCSVVVELAGSRKAVVVKSARSNVYEAVQAAFMRLGESVGRALSRRRRLNRVAVMPPPLAVEPLAS